MSTARRPRSAAPAAAKAAAGSDRLLHELQVHQAELESQNEELRRTQAELAAARDRFVDLYDFAPVGYLTLDDSGMIVEANLTVATLLGVDREALTGERFARYVLPESADAWHRHQASALRSAAPQRIELQLVRPGAAPMHGRLDCLRTLRAGEAPTLRVSLIDVTDQHDAERTRRIADSEIQSQEAQRFQAARELHEELGQRLSALKLELSHWQPEDQNEGLGEAGRGHLLGSLDEAIATLRRITGELAPLMLRDLGLPAAVDWLVHDAARRSGRPIALSLDLGDSTLSNHTLVTLYRLVQDMLGLLFRDGGTGAVRLELRRQGQDFEISLETRGGALRALAVARPGESSALHNRAHLLGAHIDVHARSAQRTRLTVHLPLAAAPAASPA